MMTPEQEGLAAAKFEVVRRYLNEQVLPALRSAHEDPRYLKPDDPTKFNAVGW